MGVKTIFFGVWLIGYAIGFFAYLAFPGIEAFLMYWLPMIFVDMRMVGAFLTGLAGSILSTVAVVLWSYFSRNK